MSKHRGEMTNTEIEKRSLRDQGILGQIQRLRETKAESQSLRSSDGHFEADKGRLSETGSETEIESRAEGEAGKGRQVLGGEGVRLPAQLGHLWWD